MSMPACSRPLRGPNGELRGPWMGQMKSASVLTRGGVERVIVVDGVSHGMYNDEQEAVFDMRLSGREVVE